MSLFQNEVPFKNALVASSSLVDIKQKIVGRN